MVVEPEQFCRGARGRSVFRAYCISIMFSMVIYIQIYFDKYFKCLPFKFTKMNFNCFDWGADQISENCNFVVRILMKKIEGYRRVSRKGVQGFRTPALFRYSPNCALKFSNQFRRKALKNQFKNPLKLYLKNTVKICFLHPFLFFLQKLQCHSFPKFFMNSGVSFDTRLSNKYKWNCLTAQNCLLRSFIIDILKLNFQT